MAFAGIAARKSIQGSISDTISARKLRLGIGMSVAEKTKQHRWIACAGNLPGKEHGDDRQDDSPQRSGT
jgi:hypothetical protein